MKHYKLVIGTVVLGAIAIGLFTLAVMLLWNWLMPELFNLSTIDFWQAMGLLALSKIFFSGFGGAHHSYEKKKKKHWHKKFEEKWRNMSHSKHDEFAQKMKDKGYETE